MQPRITLITLGVDDLERAVAFYRDGLGCSTPGIFGTEHEHGAVAFFELESGLRLGLWARRRLAKDVAIPVGPRSATEFSLWRTTSSRDRPRSTRDRRRRAAGATIVKRPEKTFYGGYAGYFQDPDGHLWEVAFNPGADALG